MEFPAAASPNPGPARSPDPPGAEAAKEWIYGDLWGFNGDLQGFHGI